MRGARTVLEGHFSTAVWGVQSVLSIAVIDQNNGSDLGEIVDSHQPAARARESRRSSS